MTTPQIGLSCSHNVDNQMFIGIIYCATSPNGKKYYGQTVQGLEKRKQRHKRDLLKGINWIFYQALKKYGWKRCDKILAG